MSQYRMFSDIGSYGPANTEAAIMVPDFDPDIGSDPISGHQDTISEVKYPISGLTSGSISGMISSGVPES
jgi:hypothetical protein